MLHITVHAEERFLERVFGYHPSEITIELKKRAGQYLEKELDVEAKYQDGWYRLPSFPDYVAIVCNDRVVTIRPKK